MQHPKCSFHIKNWILIMYSFCTILFIKCQILYILPPSANCNSNFGVEGGRRASPPKCSFHIKNWIIILYSFCTTSQKICTPFLRYRQFKFERLVICSPLPKCNFNIKNWIIILYSICTILYTKSQILCTLPSCAIANSNFGVGYGRHAFPQNAVST